MSRSKKAIHKRVKKASKHNVSSGHIHIGTVNMESKLRKNMSKPKKIMDMQDYVYKQPKMQVKEKKGKTTILETLKRAPVLHKGVKDYVKPRTVKPKRYAKDDRVMTTAWKR